MINHRERKEHADERGGGSGSGWRMSKGAMNTGALPQHASATEPYPGDDESDLNDFVADTPRSIKPNGAPWVDFDDELEQVSKPHVAMYWTAGIGGGGLLLIGAFLLYNKVLMPTPEPMGAPFRVALPTPDMVAPSPSVPSAPPEPGSSTAAVAEEPGPSTAAVADGREGVAPGQGNAVPVSAAQVSAALPAGAAAILAAAPAAAGAVSAAVPAGAVPAGAAPASAAPTSAAPTSAAPASAAAASAAPASAAPVSAAVGDYAKLLAEARGLGVRNLAELRYLKAIEVNPAGAEALSGLSMLYASQGKDGLAKARAKQALALDQNIDEAWIVLGAAESALGNERAARDAYTRCAGLPSGKYVAECRRLLR